jgi:IPT/TIG domain
MKKQSAFLAACAALLILAIPDCNKTSTGTTVTVTGVNPTHGNAGTLVTITGTGFNPDHNIDSVGFGFVAGKVVSATSTQIVVTAPPNPDPAISDSVPVLVAIQGALVGAGYFTYDKIGVTADAVSSFAGSGRSGSKDDSATNASFSSPENGAFDKYGNLYVADYGNNEIRKITPNGVVSTFAGNTTAGFVNGHGKSASFSAPSGLVFDTQGNLYVSDELNNAIRKIDPSGNVSTFAGNGNIGVGNGIGTAAQFQRPIGIAIDTLGGNLFVADSRNNMIREINLSTAMVTTLAGQIGFGAVDGAPYLASFNSPRGIALTSAVGQVNLFIADYGNNKIREIVILNNTTAIVLTLAGNPTGAPGFGATPISFNGPNSVAIGTAKDGATPELFVADANNHAIRYDPNFDPNSNLPLSATLTLTGNGSSGLTNGSYANARFDFPDGVVFNPIDRNLYVIEFGNNDIRKIVLQ